MTRIFTWIAIASFAAPSLASAEPKKVALLVGVNKYEKRGFAERPLDYAERDAEVMATELTRHGFTCRKLLGRNATKAAIDQAVDDVLGSGLPADAVFLIGFAGHGQQIEVAGKEDAFFCPFDAVKGEGESMVSLTKLLTTLDRRGGINLVLVDACRDDPTRSLRSITGNELEGKLPANTAVLFSCAARQEALESEKAGGGHGVFFHHVIQGLRGEAADRTGRVTWSRLALYVQESVNAAAIEWFPERAELHTDGQLQTPHELRNLVAIPLLATIDPPKIPPPTIPPTNTPRPQSPALPVPANLQSTTNSIGMKLILIPAGEFQMGSPAGDSEASADEKPQHRVRNTKPFYLGQTEVTQAQWQSVMGTTPWSGMDYVKEDPDYPATYVSHDDAAEFCRKLSEKEGKTYRLPTEAEWEYACRAGTTTKYYFGDDASLLRDYAWFADNADKIGEEYAHQVGRKLPNPWGLYDMHGNVWEWCYDWYDAGFYAQSRVDDPAGVASGSYRVSRGGSWLSSPQFCRSALRYRYSPGSRYDYLGFRPALVP